MLINEYSYIKISKRTLDEIDLYCKSERLEKNTLFKKIKEKRKTLQDKEESVQETKCCSINTKTAMI